MNFSNHPVGLMAAREMQCEPIQATQIGTGIIMHRTIRAIVIARTGLKRQHRGSAHRRPEYHYRYVSLERERSRQGLHSSTLRPSAPMAGSTARPTNAIQSCKTYVAVYRNGKMTILQTGNAADANDGGTVGGSIFVGPDPDHLVEQAALFKGGTMQLIPPRPGSISSRVIELHQLGHRAAWNGRPPPTHSAMRTSCIAMVTLFRCSASRSKRWNSPLTMPVARSVGIRRRRRLRSRRSLLPSSGSRTLLQPVEPTIPIPRLRKSTIAPMLSANSFDPFGAAIGVWRNQTFHIYFVEATAILHL